MRKGKDQHEKRHQLPFDRLLITISTEKEDDAKVAICPEPAHTFRGEAQVDKVPGNALPVLHAEVGDVLHECQPPLHLHLCHETEVQDAELAVCCPQQVPWMMWHGQLNHMGLHFSMYPYVLRNADSDK